MKQQNSLPLPPGSFGLPFVGETLNFVLNSEQFAKERHQKYGSIFKSSIFGMPTVFVKGAEANRFVLINENKYFVNSLPPNTQVLLGAASLSSQLGDVHQHRRKLLYQAFQPRLLSEYLVDIENTTQYYCHRWLEKKTFAWYPELRKYTFDIACKFLIGLNRASQTNLGHLFETWSAGLFSFSPPLPWTKAGRALHSRKQILDQLETIIYQERGKTNEQNNNALSILLQACDEQGNPLTLEEIKDQILTLLFAGHETLTSALASFCLLLAQYPDVFSRCHAEVQEIIGMEKIDLDSLKELKYIEQVIHEVLRLIPPVGGGFRRVIQTCEFNGFQFPQGWNVIYQISQTHQDKSIYLDADQFNPDRFSPKNGADHKIPFSYLPFGGGMRECLGKELARLEMKLFAIHLVQNYTWKLLSSQSLKILLVPVPHPKDGLKVEFKKL